MQHFLLNSLLFASGSVALTFYTNSSALPSSSTAATQDPVGSYILQDLGTSTGEFEVSGDPTEATSSTASTSSSSILSKAANVSYYSAPVTSEYPLYYNVFTATPKISTATQAMSRAMQCWSDIATWRNSSALFWNANVADRTWSITSSWSSTSMNWTRTSTLYPASVSIYSLCDGTPRADVRPTTTIITGTSTLWGSFTATLTPTFAAQPCSLQSQDCRILYQDTNVEAIDDREILRQCGNPAHVSGDAQCLLGGGPVEIIYFPVSQNDTNLCKGNSSTISTGPLVPGMSEISTLGHTFTSASVYISFKTLFATYDGFWDTVGPTFTDYIVPLHSTDISTQCGGWGAAYGAGTALNYADLNWPVRASAYKCQDRCAVSLASSAYITKGIPGWSMYDAPIAPECSTIWSDINPVVALPSKIRDMVPEWSSCSFYNDYLANFWFDPPIALQPQQAVAKPTLPISLSPQSTSAAPASTPDSALPQNTQAAASSTFQTISTAANTVDVEPPPSSTSHVRSESYASNEPLLFTVVDITATTTPSADLSKTTAGSGGVVSSVAISDHASILDDANQSNSIESAWTAVSFEYDPIGTQAATPEEPAQAQTEAQSSLQLETATAAGFSILTQALSSPKNTDPAPTASASVLPAIITSGIVVTSKSGQVTEIQPDDHFILDSTTVSLGGVLTVSGIELSLKSGGLVAGGSTFTISALPTPTATRTAYVVAPGSFTLSATPVKGNSGAVQVGTATLSIGGPAATVSGKILTKATNGIVLLPPGSQISGGTAFPSVVNEKPAERVVLAAGGHTVTAVILTGDHTAYVIGGETLSLGGGDLPTQGATFTVGPGGLGVVRPQTSLAETNSTSRIPSVVVTRTSATSRWSSSAAPAPTSTSAGKKVGLGWIRIIMFSGTFMCLFYV